MSTVAELDVKEIKDLIVAFREDVDRRMSGIENRLTTIETRLTVVETRLDTWKPSIDKIPDLAEKFGELKNWRQIAFVVTATFGRIMGWLARGGSLVP